MWNPKQKAAPVRLLFVVSRSAWAGVGSSFSSRRLRTKEQKEPCVKCSKGVFGGRPGLPGHGKPLPRCVLHLCGLQPEAERKSLLFCQRQSVLRGGLPVLRVPAICRQVFPLWTSDHGYDPAGPREVLPPRLLPLRHLQRVPGRGALHRGLREQDLLRPRLPQGAGPQVCSLWASHPSTRGLRRDHPRRVHGQRLPRGVLPLRGLRPGTQRRRRPPLLPPGRPPVLSLLPRQETGEEPLPCSSPPAPLLAGASSRPRVGDQKPASQSQTSAC
ncbi:LIM domain-containing protein 1 isoform X1 [Prionailurus viverrinus]|uniref:LIM domain-containing protein 1 isoform X1 n=1 Tax=Prionailurus viverrinus TaxID=61388 RepID=UPI001FF499F9|nr:LIM domain-containing protein 1 isoform X1 [Prionailurus viverrinus]